MMHLRMKENSVPPSKELFTSEEEDVPDLKYVMNFFRFVFKNVSCFLSLSNG